MDRGKGLHDGPEMFRPAGGNADDLFDQQGAPWQLIRRWDHVFQKRHMPGRLCPSKAGALVQKIFLGSQRHLTLFRDAGQQTRALKADMPVSHALVRQGLHDDRVMQPARQVFLQQAEH